MTRRLAPLALASVAGFVLPMTLASGASAAVWHHDDETGARPSAGDIDQVRISAGEKVVTMRVEFNGRVPYQTDVFLDVDRSRKGPSSSPPTTTTAAARTSSSSTAPTASPRRWTARAASRAACA